MESPGTNAYSSPVQAPYNYYIDNKTDINGDGLPDYVYVNRYLDNYDVCENNATSCSWSKKVSRRYMQMKDCVYFSNGQGWDLAYRCVVEPKSISGRGHIDSCITATAPAN